MVPKPGSRPPCDVCLRPVRFDVLTREFVHLEPTWCSGIDGVILDVSYRDWVTRDQRRSPPT
ncbi:hypothetical protein ACQEVB_01050 [Pseudonocardia sp. CA-107938]|uniref:hypothetical protein n=1 Tax=Pseudonocardia sp. CA-107938 TaxID=3240021 RepID=UPI003D9460DA